MPIGQMAETIVVRISEMGKPSMQLHPVFPDSAADQPLGEQICIAGTYHTITLRENIKALGYRLSAIAVAHESRPNQQELEEVVCLSYRLGGHKLWMDMESRASLHTWSRYRAVDVRWWKRVGAWVQETDLYGRILTIRLDWPRQAAVRQYGYSKKARQNFLRDIDRVSAPTLPLTDWIFRVPQSQPQLTATR